MNDARLRKTVACLGALLVLLVLWFHVFGPMIRATKASVEHLDDIRFQSHRLSLLPTDDTSRLSARLAEEANELRPLLIEAANNDSSDSTFLREIERLTAASGVRVLQTNVEETDATGPLTAYSLRVSLQGDESQLIAFISSVENNRPLLFIAEANIASTPSGQTSDGRHAAPELTATLVIRGFGLTKQIPGGGRPNAP